MLGAQVVLLVHISHQLAHLLSLHASRVVLVVGQQELGLLAVKYVQQEVIREHQGVYSALQVLTPVHLQSQPALDVLQEHMLGTLEHNL